MHAHPTRLHADDMIMIVEAGQTPLILGNKLGLEGREPVTRNILTVNHPQALPRSWRYCRYGDCPFSLARSVERDDG